MRLRLLAIDEFRSLANVRLEPDGLVVLFGANSSGKTTIIDGVRELLAGKGEMRRDPFGEETGDPYVDGWVVFELVGGDVDGHPDRELYRRLFTGELSKGDAAWPWQFIEEGTVSLLQGLEIEEAQHFIGHAYAELAGPGRPEDRLSLANELIRTPFFRSTFDETWLIAVPSELSSVAREAAARIAAFSGDGSNDPLVEDAVAVSEDRAVLVGGVADGFVERDEIRASFGGFVDINAELVGLGPSVHDDIIEIHDLMWSLPVEPDDGREFRVVPLDGFLLRGAVRYAGDYRVDTWLEVQGEEPAPGFELATDAQSALRWHRVRPSVLAIARILEEHANALAPGFVRDAGRIRLDVLSPLLWHENPSRLRIAFEDDGRHRDLAVVGAGIARWAAASLRLAGSELKRARRVVNDEHGREVSHRVSEEVAVDLARRDPLNQTTVEMEVQPPTTPVTHLVDEPEAHLHPKAVASMGEWLCQLVDRGHEVVVATHHPALLTQLADRAQLLLVTKSDGLTVLRDVSQDLQGELQRANAELGLTPGELLLMTRLALFVEGPHDQAVLLGMFGDDLAAAGVRIFPLHGFDNALALVDSEVIDALGVRMAVLTDNVDRQRIGRGEGSTYEERATLRLIKEAKLSGKTVSPFGLNERDIVAYLDDEVCRSKDPSFPGWRQAAQSWNAAGRPVPFKDYVTSEFGLPLNRDAVHRLAAGTAVSGRVPAELVAVVRAICARAASS